MGDDATFWGLLGTADRAALLDVGTLVEISAGAAVSGCFVVFDGHVRVVETVHGPGFLVGSPGVAVDPVRGLMVTPSRLAALGVERPRIAWARRHVPVSRSLTGGSALHRVAVVLADTASVPLSQRELAELAGISRETFVRALKVLRDKGIVRTQRNRVTILREDDLRAL